MAPATIGSLWQNPVVTAITSAFAPGQWLYNYAYIALIVFFAYFYTAMMFNPVDVADNLKKHGGYIPGIRPGKQTAEYIDHLLTRLTGAGALYLAAVCILPTILITQYGVPFYFATPHHAWERGTCENTNGLLRQYLPKGADLATLRQADCDSIAQHLNRRPRKRLGFRTPEECFYGQ